jgi:hypothetical protein
VRRMRYRLAFLEIGIGKHQKDVITLLDFSLQFHSRSDKDGPSAFTWYLDMNRLQEIRLGEIHLRVYGMSLYHGGDGWMKAIDRLTDDDIEKIRLNCTRS